MVLVDGAAGAQLVAGIVLSESEASLAAQTHREPRTGGGCREGRLYLVEGRVNGSQLG